MQRSWRGKGFNKKTFQISNAREIPDCTCLVRLDSILGRHSNHGTYSRSQSCGISYHRTGPGSLPVLDGIFIRHCHRCHSQLLDCHLAHHSIHTINLCGLASAIHGNSRGRLRGSGHTIAGLQLAGSASGTRFSPKRHFDFRDWRVHSRSGVRICFSTITF